MLRLNGILMLGAAFQGILLVDGLFPSQVNELHAGLAAEAHALPRLHAGRALQPQEVPQQPGPPSASCRCSCPRVEGPLPG